VSDQLPSLLQQGNITGARALISKASALASSSLSNAPAAELTLRWKLRASLVNLNDAPKVLEQSELINRLLPRVPDDQLPIPRDEIRIHVSATRLWAADEQILKQEQAMKELEGQLEGLYADFIGRKPPAKEFAASCRLYQRVLRKFLQPARKQVRAPEITGLGIVGDELDFQGQSGRHEFQSSGHRHGGAA